MFIPNKVTLFSHNYFDVSIANFSIPNKVTLFFTFDVSIAKPERFNVVISFLTYTYGLKLIRINLHEVIFEPGNEPWHVISTNVTYVDSGEPVQPPFKLRDSKLSSVSSITVIEYSSDERRL